MMYFWLLSIVSIENLERLSVDKLKEIKKFLNDAENELNEYGIIFDYKTETGINYDIRIYETYCIRSKDELDSTFMKGISNLFFLCGKKCFSTKQLKNIVFDKIELGVTSEKPI
jgi:DNA polymerase I-like protein with 3'-5' exonuclease and polymerase domains